MPGLRKKQLHDGWRFVARSWPEPPNKLGYSHMEWLDAAVPGHVHADLQRAGVIADPFAAMHELGAQWVDEEDWIYELDFTLEPADGARRVLRFDGLDTICRLFIDGTQVASADNMFVPQEVDVSHLSTGAHVLRVEFQSAARVGRERQRRYFEQEGLRAGTVRFKERAFVRKAQYMFGWDWGPRLASAGIWQPVSLLSYDARLLDVHVHQEHDASGVTLTFSSEVEGEGQVLHFLEGAAIAVGDAEPLRVDAPRLWWPTGLGEPALYRVHTVLLPNSTPLSHADRSSANLAQAVARALDARETRIGLRTIDLRRQPDTFGESFEFVVNGKPLWSVGANWIPDHSFPSLIGRDRLRRQLQAAVDMNMNMLRVWGGGLYESDEFYDLCDELGILVWQDFPYACSYYPDGPEAMEVAQSEAAVHVKRLRNHASLALWCGNNENLLMFETGWEGRENNPPRLYGENIYERTLPQLLQALDPDRPYVRSSPAGGEKANDDIGGDQHYWDVWHGRGDWKYYEDSRARFSSEFGFASAPGHRSWKRISAEALTLPPRHAFARWHDKTLKGYDTFVGYVELHYPTAANIEEWTYYSQLNQRDALRFGIEHYRRSEFCKGTLIWQLNDCWPVQSWAIVDFDAEYKAAAYEMRRLYAPLLLSLEQQARTARLWTILDNAHEMASGEAWVEATSLSTGETLARWTKPVELQPGERRLALECDVSQLAPTETLLCAGFELGPARAGELASGNEQPPQPPESTFRLLAEPKECTFARPSLSVEVGDGWIEVNADRPLVDLFVWEAHDRARFVDNFATLPRGGRRRLRVEGEVRELHARCLAGKCTIR